MSATCQCGRPVDGATLCNACTAALVADLQAVPDLAAELDVTLARQARFGERNGGRSAEKPLPYDVRASEAGWVLRNTLTTWARVIIEEMAIPGPGRPIPAPNVATGYPRQGADIPTAQIATWLAGHVSALRTHPAAGEAAEEIREAIHQARRAIDRPADRTYTGPCTCGVDLYAKPGRTTITCHCGTTHDVEARRAHMRAQLHDHLGTAGYVATIAVGLGVHVTPQAIRMWHNRHHLNGIDSSSGRLFRVGDVIDLAQRQPTPAGA